MIYFLQWVLLRQEHLPGHIPFPSLWQDSRTLQPFEFSNQWLQGTREPTFRRLGWGYWVNVNRHPNMKTSLISSIHRLGLRPILWKTSKLGCVSTWLESSRPHLLHCGSWAEEVARARMPGPWGVACAIKSTHGPRKIYKGIQWIRNDPILRC